MKTQTLEYYCANNFFCDQTKLGVRKRELNVMNDCREEFEFVTEAVLEMSQRMHNLLFMQATSMCGWPNHLVSSLTEILIS